MGKFNEIQDEKTQSWGGNSFTTTVKEDTVEFDSAKDKFTFKDAVEVPSLKVNGESVSSQVQSDWNQNNSAAADYIKNKPTIEAQVQADWNQSDNTAADYIKNRICYDDTVDVLCVSTNFNEYGSIDSSFVPNYKMLPGNYTLIIGNNEIVKEFQLEGTDESTTAYVSLEQGGGSISWTSGEGNGTVEIIISGNPSLYANKQFDIRMKSGDFLELDEKFIPFNLKRGAGRASITNSDCNASGDYSVAIGYSTTASGSRSNSEGLLTTASGNYSHSEGNDTTASGESSHSEGCYTTASGDYSHSSGYQTTANHKSQFTFGEFNVVDPSTAAATARGNYVEVVGNGTFNARSNARTLDWSGNEQIAGTLRIGSTSTGGALLKFESNALKVSFDNGTTWQTVTLS